MSSHPSTRRRRFVVLAATAAATTTLLMAQAGPAAAQPGKIRNDGAKNAIAGNYIVVYKDTTMSKKAVAATTAHRAPTSINHMPGRPSRGNSIMHVTRRDNSEVRPSLLLKNASPCAHHRSTIFLPTTYLHETSQMPSIGL